MFPRDVVCRAIDYPQFANGAVLDEEQAFRLQALKWPKGDYGVSVASKFSLKSVEAVHEYGLDVVAKKNARAPHRFPQVSYLGFFELEHQQILAQQMELYDIAVKWRPEEGCQAHYQIELSPGAAAAGATNADRRGERSELARRLREVSAGPMLLGREEYSEIELGYLRDLGYL